MMTLLHWFSGSLMLGLAFVMMRIHFRLHWPFKLNVILVMFVCHVLMQMLASVVIVFREDTFAAATFFFVCAVTAILIPIGGLLGNTMLPVSAKRRMAFQHNPIPNMVGLRRKTWRFFLFYFGFCFILLLLYILLTESIPLYGLVSGELDAAATKIARREAITVGGRLFGMGRLFFMPFLFLLGLLGRNYFRGGPAKILCIIAMMTALVYNAWSASKAPVAMLFLLAAVGIFLKKDEAPQCPNHPSVFSNIKKVLRKKRRRIYVGLFFLVSLMIGYPVFIFLLLPVAQQGVDYLLLHVFLRIIWKPAVNSYIAIEAFTNTFKYTYFSDIKALAQLMGWEYFELSRRIAEYRGLSYFVNSPPTAIGNFFAQGGWPVLIGGVLAASALFKIVENIFYRVAVKTLPHVALYTMLLYGAFRFSWANFHTILATELIAPLLLMLCFWYFFRKSRITL